MVGGLVFTFDFRAVELRRAAGRERRPAATRRSSAAAPLQQRRRDIAGGGVRRRARVRELRRGVHGCMHRPARRVSIV